jgi:hypothetical protein
MAECKCGSRVVRQEIRVVQRCAHGHYVASGVAAAVVDPDFAADPMVPGQRRAFHGKTDTLDLFTGAKPGSWKQRALAHAGATSTKELTSTAASDLLDWLEEHLNEADPDGSRRAELRRSRRSDGRPE